MFLNIALHMGKSKNYVNLKKGNYIIIREKFVSIGAFQIENLIF